MDRHTLNRSERTVQLAREQAPLEVPWTGVPQAGIPFETALTFLKLGYRAQRAGWNGKHMWIEVMTTWAMPSPRQGDLLPFIVMRTAQGNWVPWLASQTDILSHDWAIVDDSGIEIVHGVGATPLGNQ